MAIELTSATEKSIAKNQILPQLVLEIEGIDTVFGAVRILKYIQVGDVGLEIGDSWVIGGLNEVEDQEDIISIQGTGTTINQQLMPEKGAISSISSIQISLIDDENIMTEVISPGLIVTDILYRQANLYIGFQDVAWPQDYIKIFSGKIDEVISGAGVISLNLVHPDKAKQQDIFIKRSAKLSSGINNSTLNIPITNANKIFQLPIVGPDGGIDVSFGNYVKIDDEIISVLALTSTQITAAARGQLGTVAVSHSIDATVDSFYILQDDVVSLALKTMLSGWNGYWIENIPITSINQIDPSKNVQNAIFFEGIDLQKKYGLIEGDFATISGSADVNNNKSLVSIESFEVTDLGSYMILDDGGSPFTTETLTSAVISFRSKYDTLPEGLKMTPQEVDVAQHHFWRDTVLSTFDYKIYLKDTINGREFIDQELYMTCGAYSIPREAKSSMGYHIGPIPGLTIPILDNTTVKSPSKLQMKRSVNKNFFNTIVYAFDEDTLDEKFLTGVITTDATSKSRIPIGNKIFQIKSKGMRASLGGLTQSTAASNRRLNRYKFAAEYFEKVEVLFKTGFNIDPGDLVLFNFDGLNVSNTLNGSRNREEKFYEVINKSTDLKTGNITLSLVDTNFDKSERYGLISPSSLISSGSTTTLINIEDSFGEIYPNEEIKKWSDYFGLKVRIHDENYSFDEERILVGFTETDPYQMIISPALSIAPSSGYIVDLAQYSNSVDTNDQKRVKLVHAFLSPSVAVVSGTSQTIFDVDSGDVAKFFVGAIILLHNEGYSDLSNEVKVIDITGTTITVDSALGFTPTTSHKVELIGFADQDSAYRHI